MIPENHILLNAVPNRLEQTPDRRSVVIGVGILISSLSFALAQTKTPELIVLPKGVTSPVRFTRRSVEDPHKVISLTNISLEGFLVCNGAAASRADYKELFEDIGTRYGAGDGKSTFGLPNYPVQYRSGHPVTGMAMCPSGRDELPVGLVLPFDARGLFSADTAQKP